jgi:hypothetical protein
VKAQLFDDRSDPRKCLFPPGWHRHAKHLNRAGVRPGQAERHPDRRGLARTVGSGQGERASSRHPQVQPEHCLPFSESFHQRRRLQGGARIRVVHAADASHGAAGSHPTEERILASS